MSITRSHASLLGLSTLAALGLAAAQPRAAQAQVVPYTGEDFNAGPGSPSPNANAAAALFNTAAAARGAVTTITFESAPVGAFTSLTVAPGVTLTGADVNGNPLAIFNAPSFPSGPALGGFNTTPGGANYLKETGGTATFTFARPIQAFGVFLSGIQTAFFQDTVTFSDGTVQTINAPGVGTDGSNGALDFVGFTDSGKSISQVTINAGTSAGADEIGVDDVRFVVAPEPSQAAALALGVLGLAGLMLRARRHRAAV